MAARYPRMMRKLVVLRGAFDKAVANVSRSGAIT